MIGDGEGPDDETSKTVLAIKLGVVVFGIVVFVGYAVYSVLT